MKPPEFKNATKPIILIFLEKSRKVPPHFPSWHPRQNLVKIGHPYQKFLNFQGRREGGRGGNFYRGPDLKRGPKRAKFTSF
jgi:hypothetical protein